MKLASCFTHIDSVLVLPHPSFQFRFGLLKWIVNLNLDCVAVSPSLDISPLLSHNTAFLCFFVFFLIWGGGGSGKI